MADNEQKENDLKAQIEKIADSIKEQGTFWFFRIFWQFLAAQNQPEGNGDGSVIDAETINKRLAEFKNKMPFAGARSVTKNKDWAFWNTQPVPKFEEVLSKVEFLHLKSSFQEITDENMGPIEPSRDNVRQEPYTLPKGFEWDTMDVSS